MSEASKAGQVSQPVQALRSVAGGPVQFDRTDMILDFLGLVTNGWSSYKVPCQVILNRSYEFASTE